MTQPNTTTRSKYELGGWGAEAIHGDGYDFMEGAANHGWGAVGAWGADGWDAGDWPYVVFYLHVGPKGEPDRYQTMQYVEGDLTVTKHPTLAHALCQLDTGITWYWANQPGRYGLTGADLSAPQYHGPHGDKLRARWSPPIVGVAT